MSIVEASKYQPSYEELVSENSLLKQAVGESQALRLTERMKELEDRLAQDSYNSSKPLSRDIFRQKIKSCKACQNTC